MNMITKMYKVHKTRKYMLREIRREVDPKEFLRSKKDRIGYVMEIEVCDSLIDGLRILERIPGYDLYLYLKDKAAGFTKLIEFGRRISQRTIYAATNRIVACAVEKYELYNYDLDSQEVREKIERAKKLIKKVLVHEFVHIVDHERETTKEKQRKLGFLDTMALVSTVNRGEITDQMWDNVYAGLARVPRTELIVICATSLILEEDVLNGSSEDYVREYNEVDARMKQIPRLDLRNIEIFGHLHEFFVENRHLIATRFLADVMVRLGEYSLYHIINSPPRFDEMVYPERYLA